MQQSIRSTGQGLANLLEHNVWPGIHAWWGRKYDEHPMEYTRIFNIETSDKAYEEDVEVTGFGLAPVKAEAQAVTYDSEIQQTVTRYTNVAYALGYVVTREEMDDCQYEVVSKRRSEALAFSMRQTKEIVHANILNNAFTSGLGGDGVVLGSASHPTLSGNQSNILAVAADLSEAALESMVIQIMGATNNRGLKISIMPKDLIIPRQEWFNATRIVKAVLQSGTANNDPNALRENNVFASDPVVNHYLTDPDAWFVTTNCPRGLTSFDRVGMEFTQDNDFDTENAKAKCYERYIAKWTDFRGVYLSAGA